MDRFLNYDHQPEHGFQLWHFKTLSLDHFELWTSRRAHWKSCGQKACGGGSGQGHFQQKASDCSIPPDAMDGSCCPVGQKKWQKNNKQPEVASVLSSCPDPPAGAWDSMEVKPRGEWPGRSLASGKLVLSEGIKWEAHRLHIWTIRWWYKNFKKGGQGTAKPNWEISFQTTCI